jgi:diaminopimelate decarboxylase
MAHIGRHSADLEVWLGMAESVAGAVAQLHREWDGWMPKEIDLGGGFAVPRDPFGRAHGRKDAPPAPSPEEYAGAMTQGLRDGFVRHGLSPAGIALEVEPGRAMYGNIGVHLATVRNLKEQRDPFPWRWIETDTSDVFLLDTILEGCRWTVVPASNAGAPATQTADVVGISCGFDVIVPEASLPEVGVGEVLAFFDTGAYQDACANNFNAMPRPATVLVSGDSAVVIKRRETIEEVYARDVIPDRLVAVP